MGFGETIIPLVSCALLFGIPIIAILTSHQRKMAEILRQNPQNDLNQQRQFEYLQVQINELKALVQDNIIRNDTMRAMPPVPNQDLEKRLNS